MARARVAGTTGTAEVPNWEAMTDPGGTVDGEPRRDAPFLDRLLQSSSYITATATGDGVFTSLRGPVFELFGYEADQIVGTNFLDHVDLDSDPRQLESVAYALEHEGLRLPMHFRVRLADGSHRMVEVIANSALADPMINGLVVFIRPIDERLLLDAVLESMARGDRVDDTLALAVGVLSSDTLAAQGAIAYRPRSIGFTAMAATAQVGNPRAPGEQVQPPGPELDPADPSLPWNRARATGEEQLVAIDELPAVWIREWSHLAAACWAVPVPVATTDQIEACIIVLRPGPEPPEPSHRVTIERLVRLVSLAIERDQQATRLLHAARHDSLTALPNREQFFHRLERELGRAQVEDSTLAVFYVDLDGFKPVNDQHGHLAGDEVLVEASRRIEAAVRPGDLVARLGGDEFAVICPDLSSPARPDDFTAADDILDAAAIATRLVDALAQPIELEHTKVVVGASVGFAVARPDDQPETVLDAADRALYAAKADGKGRWIQAHR